MKGELHGPALQDFFSDTIKTSSKKQKAACTNLPGSSCTTEEKFTSRWDDMRLACYLLGNSFRMDSGKPPEKGEWAGRVGGEVGV